MSRYGEQDADEHRYHAVDCQGRARRHGTDRFGDRRWFNPTGNIRFYLFGPDNPTCNFDQTSANEPHGWIFMAGPIALVNGKASVPPPGFTATRPASTSGLPTTAGTPTTPRRGWVRQGTRHHRQDPTSITSVPRALTARRSARRSRLGERHREPPDGKHAFLSLRTGQRNLPDELKTDGGSAHGWIFMAGPFALVDGKASVPAPGYITTEPGVYQWVVDYGGDANNTEALSVCGKEPVTIGKHSTSLKSTPSAGGVTGTVIWDTVKVSDGVDPSGTITFSLYSPSDGSCSGPAIFTSTIAMLADGTARSASFSGTKAAGTYEWIAVYSGDANNAGSNDKCGDEPVHITAVSSGVQGITTPGTGVGFPAAPALGLLLGGLGVTGIASAEIRRTRRLS